MNDVKLKPKTIFTIILVVFVVISISYLVTKEFFNHPSTEKDPTDTSISSEIPYESQPALNTLAKDAIVVYYFHGYYRCRTCLTIEAWTKEAIISGFPDDLKEGRLQFIVLNMQDPANEAYVKDFQLAYYIVVLERIKDGERKEWKKLEKIWDLLKDEDAFIKYVQDETRICLEKIEK